MTTLDFVYVSHEISNAKPKTFIAMPESYGTREECDTLGVVLQDKELDIRLILTYGVSTNVILQERLKYSTLKIKTLQLKAFILYNLILIIQILI